MLYILRIFALQFAFMRVIVMFHFNITCFYPSEKIDHILMNIHPATAGNVEEQYVCVRLHLELPDTVSFQHSTKLNVGTGHIHSVLLYFCKFDLPSTCDKESHSHMS